MNASQFLSESLFRQLQKDAADEKIIDPCHDNPYIKKWSINGNRYTLRIHAGRYSFGNHDYFVSLWYDYNYKGKGVSREIGGGAGGSVKLDSYQSFKDDINQFLKRYPDFKEEAPEYGEQLSLF